MLVIEDRNRAPVLAKDVGHLLEELIARILRLLEFALRIIAVLADDQHGVNCEFVSAATQRLSDRRIDGKSKLLGTLAAQVILRLLIDIRRDHIQRWPMPATIDRIADQKPLGHMPSM